MKWAPWLWFALCQVIGFFVLFPLGWLIVGAACACSAWTPADTPSIKPLPNREKVDRWTWPINLIYGNKEDGTTGRYALGSWTGFYNQTGSRWKAFEWSGLRNSADGWNYITWLWASAPPLYVTTWLGGRRQLKIGWQQRYGCTVMVCSA